MHLRHQGPGPSLWQAVWADTTDRVIPAWVGIALSVVVAFVSLVRGVSMLVSPNANSPINAYVDLIGAEFYGTCIAVSGLLLVLACVSRKAGILALAHALSGAIYAGYCVAVAQGVFAAGETVLDYVASARFILFGAALIPIILSVVYIGHAREAYRERIADGDL